MKRIKFYLIPLVVFVACSNSEPELSVVSKPELFEFGSDFEEMSETLTPICDSLVERMHEVIQLPTASESQYQLDCYGYLYAGKKRKVELIFADNQLDMIWILTEAEEESWFIEEFTKLYGQPTHVKDDVTFFLTHGVAVRNSPHEVLFISDRLKEPYEQFLNQ